MSAGGETSLLDTWTSTVRASRHDRIVRLTRYVLGEEAAAQPWDVATAALLELAGGNGDAPLDAVVSCPVCGAPAEIPIPVRDLLVAASSPTSVRAAVSRVPTVAQMSHAATLDASFLGAHLAVACGLSRLDEAERGRALAALDDAHPLLAPAVAFGCPSCGAQAELAIDVVDLAWSALAERARACMDDVVALAGAFGWSEQEVLAVPAPRRALYRRAVEESAGRD